MAQKHRRRGRRDASAPTPERYRQGTVELSSSQIKDHAGIISRPYITVDTLSALERRGTITREMHRAGEEFREEFRKAHLDQLRAASLQWSPKSAGDTSPSVRVSAARKKVVRTLNSVGGEFSPAGSCLYYVVGLEWTIKAWALLRGWQNRPVLQESASGMLVAALGMIVEATA